MEMTFKRPSHNRQLTFAEISRETKLPINEIELLVMKALSEKLVKGAIDQASLKKEALKSSRLYIQLLIFFFLGGQYREYDMGATQSFGQNSNIQHGREAQ
ncbi:hypothetical protein NQ314_007267 [Rhamnusium bicolor]|uniref:26S proteasome non-ATPase regulatory subunit 13 n=1 Tax=Rhamnusium bicolor TaxID=1586634 RepID=A0AAV8YRT9_9CUCU|nr:hypothetical protein NQ314_007267 [Rhamnusium bicolor]